VKADFKNLDLREIENELCKIRDVRAARVIKGKNNSIEEIHILAIPNKGPKQLVSDIESALLAEYGLPINHKKVNIARLGNDETADPNDDKKTRLRIIGINVDISGVYSQIQVALELDGKEYEGFAKGPTSRSGQTRLAAQATLNAMDKFVKGAYSFALEDVSVSTFGQNRVTVACVAIVSSAGEQIYCGSAIVRQNEEDSVARATLDAINRRLSFLITT
jgi:hypothetical protein